jgi:hypothetical protein
MQSSESKQGPHMVLDGHPLLLPHPPKEEDLAFNKRNSFLFNEKSYTDTAVAPYPFSISGTSTNNNTTMSLTSTEKKKVRNNHSG